MLNQLFGSQNATYGGARAVSRMNAGGGLAHRQFGSFRSRRRGLGRIHSWEMRFWRAFKCKARRQHFSCRTHIIYKRKTTKPKRTPIATSGGPEKHGNRVD